MKLETGGAKGRDLPFRRENYLGILKRVFNIVLLQSSAGEDTMGWPRRNPTLAFRPKRSWESSD